MPIYTKPSELPEWASGQPVISGWTVSTAYTSGTFVTNAGGVYLCTTSGTSASSGSGPSSTSTAITDGSAVWSYSHSAYTAGPVAEPSSYQKGLGFQAQRHDLPIGILNWLFNVLYTWALYLSSLELQALSWKRPQAFAQTLTGTNAGTAWQSSTAFAVDDIRTNDSGKVYICTTAGTSAASGGPTGTGAAITDGTVTWKYLRGPAPAIEGTSAVSGKAGVRGVGTGDGAAPGLSTADVLQFETLASDPGSPVEGQVWYNSTSHTWKGRKNGSTVTFTTS